MNDSSSQWQLYICRACGLIYNEEDGDPDSGLAPGTRFEDIPADWECPLCGVTKTDFELFERPVVDANASVFKKQNSQTPGIIIIGAGIAGWSMAEAIRQQDTQTPVTMISACSGDVYHKPELSVAIGRQMPDKSLIREKGTDAARRLGINLLSKTFVVGLSAKLNSLRTTRGSFQFDKLIFAQGAKSTIPNGIPAELCWRINHFSSWHGLKEKLQDKTQTVAIIGAGMVGCELAENLSIAGHKVKLIFRGDTPLSKILPPVAARRFAEILEEQGVQCIPNSAVSKTKKLLLADTSSSVSTACEYELELNGAQIIQVDQIISATGLKIDDRIPKMAGIRCHNGIVVDSATLETEKDDIYALGDCISLAGESCRFVSPILQQAKVIAARIRGENDYVYHHEQPIIRLKVQSCSLILEGQPVENTPWKTINDSEDNLHLEQWQLGKCVSKIELTKAS